MPGQCWTLPGIEVAKTFLERIKWETLYVRPLTGSWSKGRAMGIVRKQWAKAGSDQHLPSNTSTTGFHQTRSLSNADRNLIKPIPFGRGLLQREMLQLDGPGASNRENSASIKSLAWIRWAVRNGAYLAQRGQLQKCCPAYGHSAGNTFMVSMWVRDGWNRLKCTKQWAKGLRVCQTFLSMDSIITCSWAMGNVSQVLAQKKMP